MFRINIIETKTGSCRKKARSCGSVFCRWQREDLDGREQCILRVHRLHVSWEFQVKMVGQSSWY